MLLQKSVYNCLTMRPIDNNLRFHRTAFIHMHANHDMSTVHRNPIKRSLTSRRSFLSMSAIGLSGLIGCTSGNRFSEDSTFEGDVIVIGAGAAGMTAAHLLNQKGVQFTVLEAASNAGGRIKHNLDFTDFPIPLGAEWVHVEAEILDEILNDRSTQISTQLSGYDATVETGFFNQETLTFFPNIGFQTDLKFVGSSWLDFYSTYVLPQVSDRIVYESQVVSIDYTGSRIQVTDGTGVTRSADRVILTVPVKLLQQGEITFAPGLPESKTNTIINANVWSGLKAFIEFDEPFYPTFLTFPDSDTDDGQRLYYDAAYAQESDSNILGLFAVGQQAEQYQALSDNNLLEQMLAELDTVFDGAATRSDGRHLIQNWNNEPFAGAAYLADVESSSTSRRLWEPVDKRIYFAGEAYTRFDDWGSVHAAARSAADAVNAITG